MLETQVLIPALVGAALQEIVHWYDLRKHLDDEKDQRVLKSGWYWFWTGAMILITPVAVHFWFEGQSGVTSHSVLLTGAAVPLIFKKAVRAFGTGTAEEKLGEEEANDGGLCFGAKDYFGI